MDSNNFRLIERDKKGALELSVGTIVIIVLAMSMLILGIILVRNIMCTGIVLTDQVSAATENEIRDLFRANDFGVKCMGGPGNEVEIGSGGSRQIICIAKLEDSVDDLELKVVESKLVKGRIPGIREGEPLDDIILRSGFSGAVSSGEKTLTVAVLDVPRDMDPSSIYLKVREFRDGTLIEDHPMDITLTPVGTFTSAIC